MSLGLIMLQVPTGIRAQCAVTNLLIFNPNYDCNLSLLYKGPRYRRWPDMSEVQYRILNAPPALPGAGSSVDIGFYSMTGLNPKMSAFNGFDPNVGQIVHFDFGYIYPDWQGDLAVMLPTYDTNCGWMTGATVHYNFSEYGTANWTDQSCAPGKWSIEAVSLHEAGHFMGFGGDVSRNCISQTVMVDTINTGECLWPRSLDEAAAYQLNVMVPASTVHAFRIESGVAKWDVAAEWGTLEYQIEGSPAPSGPWTLVATDGPGVGEHAVDVSGSGYVYFRLVEIEELSAPTVKGYASTLAPPPTPPATPPKTEAELREALAGLESERQNHPRPPRNVRSGSSPAYDYVAFTTVDLVGDVQLWVADYWAYYGYSTLVVDVSAYPSDPPSFRSALKAAIDSLAAAGTKHFHLIGDASDYQEMYDPAVYPHYWVGGWANVRNSLLGQYPPGGQPELNRIPTYAVADTAGRGAGNMSYVAPYWFTDIPYADTAGDDGVPDVVLGRWPVDSVTELLSIAYKMQSYNDFGSLGGAYKVAEFIGDANYSGTHYDGWIVRGQADSVRAAMNRAAPGVTFVERYETDYFGFENRATEFVNTWNSEEPDVIVMLASNSWRQSPCNWPNKYNGWFDAGMIAASRPCLVIASSCQSASYANTEPLPTLSLPSPTPVCEDLLFGSNGAVAFIGPTMGTRQLGNFIATLYVTEEFMANPGMPMAEVWLQAVQRAFSDYANWPKAVLEVVSSYVFLGDPLSPLMAPEIATAVGDTPKALRFGLEQNVPNPFNPTTTIRFAVSKSGPVRLAIFDVTGRRVRTLVDEKRTPGEYSVEWDGRSDAGRPVATGVYFYELVMEGQTVSRKMVLMK